MIVYTLIRLMIHLNTSNKQKASGLIQNTYFMSPLSFSESNPSFSSGDKLAAVSLEAGDLGGGKGDSWLFTCQRLWNKFAKSCITNTMKQQLQTVIDVAHLYSISCDLWPAYRYNNIIITVCCNLRPVADLQQFCNILLTLTFPPR